MTDDTLRQTQEALALLESQMMHLYSQKAKYHPTQYRAVFAEPLAEEILKLRAQIDAAIGLTDFAVSGRLLGEASTHANGTADGTTSTRPAAVGQA